MGFFSVSSTICLVLLAVATAMPDPAFSGRVRRDDDKTVVKTESVEAFIRKCTADELSKGCTEAPNDFGPDKKSCTCTSSRVRRDTVTTVKTEVKKVSVAIRKCTADELAKKCTEAPNDFGADKTSCTCTTGRVRRDADVEQVKKTVLDHACTHEELIDKHCTLVADIGAPLRCECPE